MLQNQTQEDVANPHLMPAFRAGAADYIAGRGWHKNYDRWCIEDQAAYECGRQFAAAGFNFADFTRQWVAMFGPREP